MSSSSSNIGAGKGREDGDELNCEICDKIFKSVFELKIHNMAHNNQVVTKSGNLKKQTLVHTGNINHSCKQCDKTFTQAGHLKKCNVIHKRHKPHICIQCGKAGHIKKHTLTHTRGKPYSCEQCGKSFIKAEHFNQSIYISSEIIMNMDTYCCQLLKSHFGQDIGFVACFPILPEFI